ncbi:MAG TPA: helix-turn-helix transcriptional regulator [Phenylobacterium sp.]|nr:helix-turn-helix transcriptional regulator [Phenylobacterium sp.]
MSLTRQIEPDPDGFPVRGLAETFRNGHRLDVHTHPWAQLVYAVSGVMQVETPHAAWLVPPTRAIWLPPNMPHGIEMRGAVAMRSLYLTPVDPEGRLAGCRALEVAPLLRELILHIVRLGMLREGEPEHERLGGLLIDLLSVDETPPLDLPLPKDHRARGLAERILANPGDEQTLADLSRGSGASLRTLQRLFLAETGLPLEPWRRRARMQQGVVSLSAGASVTSAALEAGYQSPSAFIAAFKRAFGVTPGRYRPA